MAVPKKKKSPSRRDMRRANHDRRSAPNLAECSNCGELKLRHRICPACGFYKKTAIIAVDFD